MESLNLITFKMQYNANLGVCEIHVIIKNSLYVNVSVIPLELRYKILIKLPPAEAKILIEAQQKKVD